MNIRGFHLMILLLLAFWLGEVAAASSVTGRVVDPQGVPIAAAEVTLLNAGKTIRQATADDKGCFTLVDVVPGEYELTARSPSFVSLSVALAVGSEHSYDVQLQFRQIASSQQDITVSASVPAALSPDASRSLVLRDEAVDANPGRPGTPVSMPGLPVETASGGIKAPQYFAPGVAGDHGEPIAQFLQVGNFLAPNNLPANAHGNGYADPNLLIAPTIAGAAVDGGAFNVREGNNAVDLATSFLPQTRLANFLQIIGDNHDGDVVAGWSPRNPQTNAWLAAEAAFGDGLLERHEHRRQYKLNGEREFVFNKHDLTVLGIGYHGFSYIPGLIPIDVPVPGDTIDNRQLERTNTFLIAASDTWTLSSRRQFFLSGFYRNYSLTLRSNFGGGLIQQSETRNIGGGEAMYSQAIRPWLSLLAGVDIRRDAPRNLDLYHISDEGVLQLVTSNNLTLSFLEPFLALDGFLTRYVHYNIGVRQEEVWMENQDLVNSGNSFHRQASVAQPKGTISLLPPPDRSYLPIVAFSYGEAFHTEDPRIGNGVGVPMLLLPSRAYQLVVSKTIKQTDLSLTLRRVSNSQDLAKIDPDTGLQEIEGPSLNRVLAVSVRRNFSRGSIFVSYAQADARDVITGEPIPEAPRTIWDIAGSITRLPLNLQLRAELERVGAKPLGDGFVGVPVTEFRGGIIRPFFENRALLSATFLLARGYTGQTTETLDMPGEIIPFERAVGVPLKPYFALSWSWRFGKIAQ